MSDSLKIDVNLDNATIGDMRLFERMAAGDSSLDEQLEFLSRVVTVGDGVDIETLPLPYLAQIMQAIEAATKKLTEGTAAKN